MADRIDSIAAADIAAWNAGSAETVAMVHTLVAEGKVSAAHGGPGGYDGAVIARQMAR
jgi:hypothetical protein